MKTNTDMTENWHDLDALIKAARIHPTAAIRQRLIDAEIDYNGRFVGYALAVKCWFHAIPDHL